MKKCEQSGVIAVSCLIAASLTSTQAYAEKSEETVLPAVIVRDQGEKAVIPGGFVHEGARNGILGNKNLLDIPFTQFSHTEKTIETFGNPSLPINNILVNSPSVRTSSTSPMYTDFSVRGINTNGNNVYLNNVPNLFAQFLTPPNHIIERIDLMSGPNTVLNGSTTSVNGTNGNTAPNSIISISTKKATLAPINRYTQTFSGRSALGEYLDVGRRFGENKQWGVRINAGHLDGELAVSGMKKKERTFFVNLDHLDADSKTNIFGGYFDIKVRGGQRWFNLGSSKALIGAPDSRRSFDYNGMHKFQNGHLWTLNHERKLSDEWDLFINAGMTQRNGDKYDNSGGSLPLVGQTGVIRGALLHMVEANKNVYGQIGLKNEYRIGEIRNSFSLAMDWSWTKNYRTQATRANGSLTGNLFNGVRAVQALPIAGSAKLINHEITKSITVVDQVDYKKFSVLMALQRRENKFQAFNANTEALTEKSNHISTSPSFAIMYKPVDNISLYVSHSEGYTRARSVTDASYENYGELFKPVKNKQEEVGVKYRNNNILATLSIFKVDQGNYYDEMLAGKKYLKRDGKNEYKGLEAGINGKFAKQWNLTGGLMYLDAKRKNTANGKYDGYYVSGVAKWSGIVAAEYEVNANTAIVARMIYNGEAYGTNANKVKIPSYTTADLGMTYKTNVAGMPLTLRAMCHNVTDKDYWIARGGSNVIGLSMPRTFMLSAQIGI